MTRRLTELFVVPVLCDVCVSLGTGHAAERPDFVFFLVDDLGWADDDCFGSTFYETPHIDVLCASGMKFTEGYAASPACSPTRASIMTGRLQFELISPTGF